MYNSTKNNEIWKEIFNNIKDNYSKIPETKGCMKWIDDSKNSCNAWCCSDQHPHLLYSEFRYVWDNVIKQLNKEMFLALIERSLNAYLFKEKRKACVLWDKDSKFCSAHEHRPYNCRVYGVIPDEEFKPRYEKLKVIYPESRYQCNLITTIDNKTISKEQIDLWWKNAVEIEKKSGIHHGNIHDDFGGSYRSHYEHILLELMGENGMSNLSMVRENSTEEEKEETVAMCLRSLSKIL